jgi:hypothetical protein
VEIYWDYAFRFATRPFLPEERCRKGIVEERNKLENWSAVTKLEKLVLSITCKKKRI